MLASFGADFVLLCQSRLYDPGQSQCSGYAGFDDPVGACLLFDKESNGCVLDEEELAPL